MTIIHAPHPSLRQKAPEIKKVDVKLISFVKDLEQTLLDTSARGVGLAAPQVDKPKLRIFSTFLGPQGDDRRQRQLRTFINPRITRTFGDAILGPDEENVPLEGCLSIPSIYGPVPRFQKIELEYDVISKEQFITESDTFDDFFARVIQHELDHLNGILFTDYILEYDLPLYQDDPTTKKLQEIDSTLAKVF